MASRPTIEETDEALIERARRDLRLAWGRLRASLEERVLVIEACVVAILTGSVDERLRSDAADAASELATMFGRLGIASGADVARTLSGDLSRGNIDAPSLATLLQEIRAALGMAEHDAATAALVGVPMLIVGEPGDLVDRLVWTAPSMGVIAFVASSSMVAGYRDDKIDAAVVVQPDGGLADSRSLLRMVKDVIGGAPLVVATTDGDLSARLPVADLVDEVMSASATPAQILRGGRSALARIEPPPVRLIGRDPTRVSALVKRLSPLVPDCREIDLNSNVLDPLRSTPHVLVIDGDANGTPGHQFLRAIRSDAAGRRAGVVWLARGAEEVELQIAEDAGVDVIVKGNARTTVIAEAILRVQTRVAQTRLEGDLDGGVAPWHNGRPLLERAFQRARRHGWLVAVALLDLDHDTLAEAGIVPHHAAARVAQRLEGEFRAGDIVTWYQPLQFVVALQQAGWRIGMSRIETVVSSLGLPSGAIRVVVSEYPSHGQFVSGLLTEAERTLDSLKTDGGPQVVVGGWQEHAEAAADVVVVDSDPGVVSLLRHNLEGQGYSVVTYTDGLEASNHLSGASGEPLPRLMIFDLYLNGVSGLEMVRRLERAGTLGRFRSILLTAQPDEGDVLEALDLGVDDYMAKPFSTSMLRHRIRRALEDR
ncbi:MAG: response regulator [Actinomycetia bacterium]|nr:response regulator [Actinomycetes bacterium]MCP4957810.1 response regulator [Actinomycetes bacterium]